MLLLLLLLKWMELETIPLVLERFLQDGLSPCHWQHWQKRKVNKRLNFLQLQMMDWSSRPSESPRSLSSLAAKICILHFIFGCLLKTTLSLSLLGSRIQIKDRTLKSRIKDLDGIGVVDLGKPLLEPSVWQASDPRIKSNHLVILNVGERAISNNLLN